MVVNGLSNSYINADSVGRVYHRKRQLSHHPVDHISYIIPPSGTPWNIKKYFMDRLGVSIISGEASLAEAERSGSLH